MNKKYKRIALLIRKKDLVNMKRLEKKLRDDFLSILDDIDKSVEFNFNFKNFIKRITGTLISNFKLNVEDRAEFDMKLWGKTKDFFSIPIILKKIENSYKQKIGKKIKRIAERFRFSIENVVSEGKEKGLSYEKVATNIRKEVNHISLARSRVIALTETKSISSNIDYELATKIKMKTKTWIHGGGGKTDRPTHVNLDGVTIKINEKFNVGGSLALHPHDSSLSAKDVINCHCILIFE